MSIKEKLEKTRQEILAEQDIAIAAKVEEVKRTVISEKNKELDNLLSNAVKEYTTTYTAQSDALKADYNKKSEQLKAMYNGNITSAQDATIKAKEKFQTENISKVTDEAKAKYACIISELDKMISAIKE